MNIIIKIICCLLLPSFILSQNDYDCPNLKYNKLNDRRINKNKLTLMQYNVEWLFLDYYKNSDCPGQGCTWKNETEAYQHLNYVYNVIDKFDPDIINLCEVEGCHELNSLINLTNNFDYQPYLVKGADKVTGQNVGMITKVEPNKSIYRISDRETYPISESNCGYNEDEKTTSVSKNFVSEFTINDMNIAIISAHLISKPIDPNPCSKREAQSIILQKIINKYIKNNFEVIMIGDLNDFDNKVLDLNSNIPKSKVLDILKGHAGPLKNDYKLTNVAEKIAKEERFTNWYNSNNNCNIPSKFDYSMIDHILVTDNLLSKIKNTFIYHGYKEFCGKMNSDHYPVIVDFYF